MLAVARRLGNVRCTPAMPTAVCWDRHQDLIGPPAFSSPGTWEQLGNKNAQMPGKTGGRADQKAGRINKIDVPALSAKPPSPVQIRAAPPQFQCKFDRLCVSRTCKRAPIGLRWTTNRQSVAPCADVSSLRVSAGTTKSAVAIGNRILSNVSDACRSAVPELCPRRAHGAPFQPTRSDLARTFSPSDAVNVGVRRRS